MGVVAMPAQQNAGSTVTTNQEVGGRGTGVLSQVFRLYNVTGQGLTKVWSEQSYFRSQPWNAESGLGLAEERRAFVRIDSVDGVDVPVLRYLAVGPKRQDFTERIFELRGRAIIERPRQQSSR